MNHNVKVALVYTGLNSLSSGVWGYTVLSGYLNVLTGSRVKVGLAEGIQGTVQAIAALPAGYLADRLGREKVLHFSAFLGFLSVAGMLATLGFGASLGQEYLLMCVSLSLFGIFTGASSTPLEALFADSIATEDRPRIFQYKYTIRTLCSSTGPLTAIILFLIVGNTWTMQELRIVFASGVALLIPATMMLLSFRDEHALGEESDPFEANTPEIQRTRVQPVDGNDYHRLEDANNHETLQQVDTSDLRENLLSSQEEEGEGSQGVAGGRRKRRTSRAARYWVPRLVATSDLIYGIASGMTIKFFPLFFKDETNLTPIGVNLVIFLAALSIGLFSIVTRKIAAKFGRVQVCVFCSTVGVTLLYSMWIMGLGYDLKDQNNRPPLWRNEWVIVPVYVIRTGLMNCNAPLRKSVLMDHVDKSSRGIWSAFDSVTRFGWSGSAVIGGILAEHYGYGATFLATALVQTLATALFLFVRYYVPS